MNSLRFTSLLIITGLIVVMPPGVAAQDAERSWSAHVVAGLSSPIRDEFYGQRAFGGLGLRMVLGTSVGLSLEGTLAGLGEAVESFANLTPFPENAPGTLTTTINRRVQAAALALDVRLARGSLQPSLHFGLGAADVIHRYHQVLTNMAGVVRTDERYTRSDTYFMVNGGISIGFPRIAGVLRPALDIRYHGLPTTTDYGWEWIKFLTCGVRLTL